MKRWTHYGDILISITIPFCVWVMVQTSVLEPEFWRMYWLGALIGLSWELGFHFTGPEYAKNPSYVKLSAFPLPPIFQPLLHTLWDGGLFLIGVAWVHQLTPPPYLTEFRWQDLAIMVAWGQTQALLVELVACGIGLWTYISHPWNPALFRFGKGTITLLPQLVWLIAPVVFYVIVLKA